LWPVSTSNSVIAALLFDLAAIQTQKQSAWGYQRAAATVLELEEPIEAFLQPDGTLRKIPHVGPKSERVALDVLRTGRSDTVERAVAESGKADDVAKRRALRSNFLSRSEVLAALSDPTLGGPSRADYKGDLHMHSTWSDGKQTLDEIARTGIERGYDYVAVTDHSHGLKIARGVPVAEIPKLHAAIDEVNARYVGRFRVLKGVEANILPDGTLDVSDDDLARFDVVVAAAHAALRLAEDQTPRMIAAVSTRGVHVLGHPRGRVYGARAGVRADWDAVFAVAARENVAVEIDGDPARQDLDHALARRAVETGCLLSLSSDAHAPDQFSYAETAIAHARLAGVPRERVINCWPVDRLLEWARDLSRRSDTH
jgi:putative hydrolase